MARRNGRECVAPSPAAIKSPGIIAGSESPLGKEPSVCACACVRVARLTDLGFGLPLPLGLLRHTSQAARSRIRLQGFTHVPNIIIIPPGGLLVSAMPRAEVYNYFVTVLFFLFPGMSTLLEYFFC